MITLKWEPISRVDGRGPLEERMWYVKSFRGVLILRRLEMLIHVCIFGGGGGMGILRFSVLGCIFRVPIQRFLHVICFPPFQKRK